MSEERKAYEKAKLAVEEAVRLSRSIELPLEGVFSFYRRNNPHDFEAPLKVGAQRIARLLSPSSSPVLDIEGFQEHAISLIEKQLDLVDAALLSNEKEAMESSKKSRKKGPIPFHRSQLAVKPQESFKDGVDNTNTPSLPRLDAIASIIDIEKAKAAQRAALDAQQSLPHPLQHHLESIVYPSWQLQVPSHVVPPGSFEDTPFLYIETLDELEKLPSKLAGAREIALDLEAHTYRSFQGFVCLMQLSTRTLDVIIDALALRSHIGRILAPLFADPSIVKVLHGSDADILWMQRDFGLYIVNMFDTGQAARVLGYPAHGLGYLLRKHAQFEADKRYQLADWRIRPLTEDMIHYARADTHFLLYIFDMQRRELSETSHVPEELDTGNVTAFETVLERSRTICCSLYQRELCNERSFLSLFKRIPESSTFSEVQSAAFAALYMWRDGVAREEDESTGYVMSRAVLIKLATGVPRSSGEVVSMAGNAAPVVVRRAEEVAKVVRCAYADIEKVALLIKNSTEDSSQPVRKERSLQKKAQEGSSSEKPRDLVMPHVDVKSVKRKKKSLFVESMQESGDRSVTHSHQIDFTLPFHALDPSSLLREDKGKEVEVAAPPDPPLVSNTMHVAEQQAAVRDALNGVEKEKQEEKRLDGERNDEGKIDAAFLPLPISEAFQIRGKKKKRKTVVKSLTSKMERGLSEEPTTLDYGRAQEAFDVSMLVSPKRGRDKKMKGNHRQGKDQEKSQKKRPGKFNPYADLEVNSMRGGKRNQTQVRSGNKSHTFR